MEELKETVELTLSNDYKERFKADYYRLKIRIDRLNNMLSKMRKDEITKAPIEEAADTWVELYIRAQALSMYADAHYNELCGDVFDTEDIKDFNKSTKKIDAEMELIEQLRPDFIAYLFGGMEDEY